MLRFTHIVVKMLRAGGHHERADAVQRADAEATAGPDGPRDDHTEEDIPGPAALDGNGGSLSAMHENSGAARQSAGAGSGGAAGRSEDPGAADIQSSSEGPGHGISGNASADTDAGTSHAHGPDSDGESSAPQGRVAPDAIPDSGSAHGFHAPLDSHTVLPDETSADPLSGIRSARLRDNIQRDAFRTASSEAQDSEIRLAAERMLNPPGVPFPPTPDLSPAAQHARFEALRGELPKFAQGDARYDAAARTLSEPVRMPREAAESPSRSQTSTQPARARERDFDR